MALSRAMIVAQAVRLARLEGTETVTMRRLAEELDTSPMSLYRHVADREDLLVGMLGVVAERVRLPEPAQDPRAEITGVMTAIHEALGEDPWALRLLVTEQLASPLILPAMERIFGALARSGLSDRDARVGYALVWQYTVGELLTGHSSRPDSFARTMIEGADPAQYPALGAMIENAPPPGAAGGDFFSENLIRLLDGLLRWPDPRG